MTESLLAPVEPEPEDEHASPNPDGLRSAFLKHLFYVQGKFPALANKYDYYMALVYTVRDRLLQRWVSTADTYIQEQSRTVAYFSAEFLLGPHLGNNLINLGIYPQAKQALQHLGLNFEEIVGQEIEPGLGNGGLGRLAACYLDSLATLEIPSIGYGIRYEFGIFKQGFEDGWQVERTDKWLRFPNPWEIVRPEWQVEVGLGGETRHQADENGVKRAHWIPERIVAGTPYDTPILGYDNNTANTLRLWRAEAAESFDLETFNRGDYYGAVSKNIVSENITKVLYPNDELIQGKELRLQQQYFFVSCSLQDMLRILKGQGVSLERFPEKFTVQLNDTHPAVAIAELMHLLVDKNEMAWEDAWEITQQTFAYTNHTLLPEALEQWSVELFGRILPRHLEIIYEINQRFLDQVRVRFFGDNDRLARLSLISEGEERQIRMANLACVGSHAINGVAALHTDLLKSQVLSDFYQLWPERFSNKTNGVTPRRWIVLSNPSLTKLISQTLGEGWIRDLDQLQGLEAYADDPAFRAEWRFVKRSVKEECAVFLKGRTGELVDPHSLFDVQVKRIHEYKRQHLNILHVIALYRRLKSDPNMEIQPRTFVFGGKAAPGYRLAKLMIKLITSVGEIINRDPAVKGMLKVVFLPNFNVSNAQRIYPAADLSEQISTAGKEASGTGNMKFSMNGALTIGTLDGANVEIREEVGAENFFLFGLDVAEVQQLQGSGYRPMEVYQTNPGLKGVIDLLQEGYFSSGDRELFRPLVDGLLHHDPYLVLADYQSYVDCQEQVSSAYRDRDHWTRMSILNAARMGKFSSDRSIRDYCSEIWDVEPQPIGLRSLEEIGEAF